MLTSAASLICLTLSPHRFSPHRLSLQWQGLPSAQAHQVEIVNDVGATLHIEPNDTPRAGEEVLAWFALTKKGGKTIPLSACDCQLTVLSQADSSVDMMPALSPVDAEGYTDIPGARVTFPAVGAYTLLLKGSPLDAEGDENFSTFELEFEVTVAAGERSSRPTEALADAPEPESTPESTPESVPESSNSSTPASTEAPTSANEDRPSAVGALVFLPQWILILSGATVVLILVALSNKQRS